MDKIHQAVLLVLADVKERINFETGALKKINAINFEIGKINQEIKFCEDYNVPVEQKTIDAINELYSRINQHNNLLSKLDPIQLTKQLQLASRTKMGDNRKKAFEQSKFSRTYKPKTDNRVAVEQRRHERRARAVNDSREIEEEAEEIDDSQPGTSGKENKPKESKNADLTDQMENIQEKFKML